MKIKTVTTFKNFDMDFTLGQEFTEDLGPVDGRKCQVCGFFFICTSCCDIVFFLIYLWETWARFKRNNHQTKECGVCGADG